MPCGCTDKDKLNNNSIINQPKMISNNKKLSVESMKDMPIDEIIRLYQNGYRLEGYRLEGYRLEGYRLEGYRLEGYRLEGRKESESLATGFQSLVSSLSPPKMSISSLGNCPMGNIIQGTTKAITIGPVPGGVPNYTFHLQRDYSPTDIYTSIPQSSNTITFNYTFNQANGDTPGPHTYTAFVTDSCSVGSQTSGTDFCIVTIQAPVTVGNVTFHTNPAGAHIIIGGVDKGITTGSPTDGTLTVNNLLAGDLVYDVTLFPDYNPSTGNHVTVVANTTTNAPLITLTPTPPATGSVEFHTNPGQAEIWKGATLLCTTLSNGVCTVSNQDVGTLTFVVKMTGYIDSSPTNVTVVQNEIAIAPLVTLLPKTGSARFTTTPGGAEIWSGVNMLGTTSAGTTGEVIVPDMAVGTWFFVAKKTGYTDSSQQSVVVTYNTVTNAPPVALTPIISTGTVIFHVTCTGTPCADAHIMIGGIEKGVTLANGTLTVPNLSLGATNFNVTKTGYSSGSGTVIVTTGTTNADVINLTIVPTGDVIFHITCEGSPCADAHITISGIDRGVTLANGTLTVPNLSLGTTNFNVTKTGYTPGSGSVIVVTGTTDAPVVNLVPIVAGTGAVIFRVACGGTPCADAHIMIGGIDKGVTHTDGTLIVSGLTPGILGFIVTKAGYNNGSNNVTVISDTTVNSPVVNITQAAVAGGGGAAIFALVALGAAALFMMRKPKLPGS